VFARHPGMSLKLFNRCRFSSQPDSAILILPQAAQLDLAKKAPFAERLRIFTPCRARAKTRAQKPHSE
jgi:hypothetical protein